MKRDQRITVDLSPEEMEVVKFRSRARKCKSLMDYVRQRCIYDLDVSLHKPLRELPQEDLDEP